MSKYREAIILCGGQGSRLSSLTKDQIPKALVKISGRSILEWQFDLYIRHNVNHVVLAVGYLHEIIKETMGNQFVTDNGSVDISYSLEKEKLGSGGAIKHASQYISNEAFFISNGDILTDVNLEHLKEVHEKMNADISMLLTNMQSPYGVVEIDGAKVIDFIEKPRLSIPIHAGFDILSLELIPRLPFKGQIEDTLFINVAREKRMAYFLMDNSVFWMSIDTVKDFHRANKLWPRR